MTRHDQHFKGRAETKSKKGKYTALLGVLVNGLFTIPMAQCFWHVRDDDSSDDSFKFKIFLNLRNLKRKDGFKLDFTHMSNNGN